MNKALSSRSHAVSQSFMLVKFFMLYMVNCCCSTHLVPFQLHDLKIMYVQGVKDQNLPKEMAASLKGRTYVWLHIVMTKCVSGPNKLFDRFPFEKLKQHDWRIQSKCAHLKTLKMNDKVDTGAKLGSTLVLCELTFQKAKDFRAHCGDFEYYSVKLG